MAEFQIPALSFRHGSTNNSNDELPLLYHHAYVTPPYCAFSNDDWMRSIDAINGQTMRSFTYNDGHSNDDHGHKMAIYTSNRIGNLKTNPKTENAPKSTSNVDPVRYTVPLRLDQRLNKLSAHISRRQESSPRLLTLMKRIKAKELYCINANQRNLENLRSDEEFNDYQQLKPTIRYSNDLCLNSATTSLTWSHNPISAYPEEKVEDTTSQDQNIKIEPSISTRKLSGESYDAMYDEPLLNRYADNKTSLIDRSDKNVNTYHIDQSSIKNSSTTVPKLGNWQDNEKTSFESPLMNRIYQKPSTDYSEQYKKRLQEDKIKDDELKVKSRTKNAQGDELVGRSVFFRSALVPFGGRPPPSSTLTDRTGIAHKIKKFFIVGASMQHIAIREYLRSGTKGVELDTHLYVTKKENVRLAQGRPTKRYEAINMDEVVRTATRLDSEMRIVPASPSSEVIADETTASNLTTETGTSVQ